MKLIDGDIYLSISEIAEPCGLTIRSISEMANRGELNWLSIKDPEDERRTLILYRTMRVEYRDALSDFYWKGLEPSAVADL